MGLQRAACMRCKNAGVVLEPHTGCPGGPPHAVVAQCSHTRSIAINASASATHVHIGRHTLLLLLLLLLS
jgi:hypothetical protein